MFKKASRRVPRKIGRDDDHDHHSDEADSQSIDTASVVKRPILATMKSRTACSVRATLADRDDTDRDESIAPLRIGLNRAALERAAAERMPIREANTDAYSAGYLEELKIATPSRPSAAANQRWEENNGAPAADVTSKSSDKAVTFELTRQDEYAPSAIPSAAEIKEKKARRRRLALEEQAGEPAEDFISLNDGDLSRRSHRSSDSEGEAGVRSRSLIIPAEGYEHQSKWGETRLDRDDENIAEGYDEFVDDPGRVVMGRTGLEEQEQARKRDIQRQIRNAQRATGNGTRRHTHAEASHDDDDPDGDREGTADEDEDEDEDAARIQAYEAAQLKRGAVSGAAHMSSRQREKLREERLRRRLSNLPKPRQLPQLADVVASFKAAVTESQQEEERARKRDDELAREKKDIEEEEVRVKGLLKEAGDKFERLKAATAGIAHETAPQDVHPSRDHERGLESLSVAAIVPGQS